MIGTGVGSALLLVLLVEVVVHWIMRFICLTRGLHQKHVLCRLLLSLTVVLVGVVMIIRVVEVVMIVIEGCCWWLWWR